MELFLVSVEVCHFRLMWLPWFVSSGLGMYVCMYVCMYVGRYILCGGSYCKDTLYRCPIHV